MKPILGPHREPEIGFSESALWPGNTNRKVKPVFGFNNEAQNWLQFSRRKFEKRDLASDHLQASDRSMISSWRPDKIPNIWTHKAGLRIQVARATVAEDKSQLVHILVFASVEQARLLRAIPLNSCHVGLFFKLGRPCGSTHQQQLYHLFLECGLGNGHE